MEYLCRTQAMADEWPVAESCLKDPLKPTFVTPADGIHSEYVISSYSFRRRFYQSDLGWPDTWDV